MITKMAKLHVNMLCNWKVIQISYFFRIKYEKSVMQYLEMLDIFEGICKQTMIRIRQRFKGMTAKNQKENQIFAQKAKIQCCVIKGGNQILINQNRKTEISETHYYKEISQLTAQGMQKNSPRRKAIKRSTISFSYRT